jgi:hypothetical protein
MHCQLKKKFVNGKNVAKCAQRVFFSRRAPAATGELARRACPGRALFTSDDAPDARGAALPPGSIEGSGRIDLSILRVAGPPLRARHPHPRSSAARSLPTSLFLDEY